MLTLGDTTLLPVIHNRICKLRSEKCHQSSDWSLVNLSLVLCVHTRSEQDAMPCHEADGESTVATNPLPNQFIGSIDFEGVVDIDVSGWTLGSPARLSSIMW